MSRDGIVSCPCPRRW